MTIEWTVEWNPESEKDFAPIYTYSRIGKPVTLSEAELAKALGNAKGIGTYVWSIKT